MDAPSESTNESTTRESFPFQAEVSELLRLVINSLYSNKEIFLRELVSNASDAIDRLRFRGISEPALLEDGTDMAIRLIPDREAGTLTIDDTGVGMSKEELTKNLGTIAHSGSKAFLAQLAEAKRGDVNLIGQFGVGFYSAYLVADRVDVVSRAAGDREAWRWSSDAKDAFTIEPARRVERGTSITLHLKPDMLDLLDDWKLRELVRRYSDFVAHPIKLVVTKKVGEGEDAHDETSEESINRANALWQRSPSEVTKEQVEELYKHLTHAYEPPLAYSHFKIEGKLLFAGMVFIPKRPEMDMLGQEKRKGLRLFVKRVFILEDCDELLPPYLRFVRGVVDSDDLPLNVSRELLQDSVVIRTIKKQVIKRVLDRLDEMSKEMPDDYRTFWSAFGATLKEGIAIDGENRDRVAGLARFATTGHVEKNEPGEKNEAGESHAGGKNKLDELVSLSTYVARMPADQEFIYYAIGDAKAALAESPLLEGLKKKGYEVLLLTDPVDEFAVDALETFEGKRLKSAMRGDLALDEESKAKAEAAKTALADLRTKVREVLGVRVSDVRISTRLTDSPVCLVVPEGSPHGPMEALLRASGREIPTPKRVLEMNPEHPLIANLEAMRAQDPTSSKLAEWIETLHDQAVVSEGGKLEDPAGFARRITSLLQDAAGRTRA